MRIHELRIYEGRNIYTHKPCIKADIDLGELAEIPTCSIPGFNELLLEHIPSLIEHKCARGYRGGFVERLHEGTYLAHVLEHVCLEIQNMLGYDVAFGKARQVGDQGTIYSVITNLKSFFAFIPLYLHLSLDNIFCNSSYNMLYLQGKHKSDEYFLEKS